MRNLCLLILFIFLGCNSEPSNPKEKKPVINHNYIIIVDLSDRILQPNQIERDIELINYFYELFVQKVQKSFFINSKDNFKVVLPYQKEALPTSKIPLLEDDLYVSMESIPLREKKNIKDSKPQFKAKVLELYDLAKFSDNPNDYKGSDIHGYLRDNLQFDLVRDSTTENKIIILTDGYMYIEGKSPGIDAWDRVTDLTGIDVAILEINPSKNRENEFKRIEDAWSAWIKGMNAKNLMLMPQSAMSKVEEASSKFFQGVAIVNKKASQKPKTTLNNDEVISGDIGEINDQSNSILKAGNYYANIDGKLRTISVSNLNISNEVGSFKFDYKPYGDAYKNLEGSISKNNIDLGKMGLFTISEITDYLILTHNNDGSVYKRLKDDD